MPRLLVNNTTLSGVSSTALSAPPNQMNTVDRLLRQATGPKAWPVMLNYATGAVHPISFGPVGTFNGTADFAVALLRRGWAYVDYGQWPFGQQASEAVPGNPATCGFSYFVHRAGLQATIPPVNYATHNIFTVTQLAQQVTLRGFCYTDGYAWYLGEWQWGDQANSSGYPYRYGLPTTRTGATSTFRPMPGAPHVVLGGIAPHGYRPQTIAVYSAFAVRVGPGWYFAAVSSIDPVAYAQFIAAVLGATIPASALPTGPVSCATPVKPSLRVGDTGPWVALAQARLNAWGAHVAVDGNFGPLTEQAVLALQRAHAGQRVDHAPPITVSGEIGPGLWALLCSTPPVSIHGGGPPSSPGHPTRPATGSGGRCGIPVVSRIAQATHLSCTEAEIVLIGGALTLLAMLSNR